MFCVEHEVHQSDGARAMPAVVRVVLAGADDDAAAVASGVVVLWLKRWELLCPPAQRNPCSMAVSYTHLRAHETRHDQ